MRSFFTVIVLVITSFLNTYAQGVPGTKISGKIIDSISRQPVEDATITIIDKQTGKVVNGAISNKNGSFEVKDLPYGNFIVRAEFIGYKKTNIDNIVLNVSSHNVSLNSIKLSPTGQMLNSVTITAKTPIIENKIDKMVYNAENDITSQGGLAIDVLKKVPQVTVDIDGNVELQGNSNIRFLINGKPSSVFGNSVTDALATIPASQIKSIEVITNPGAKYDAQGTGGIINIILKQTKMQGINGNINLSAGTRLENGSANLNFRHNNFGVNVFFSGNTQLSTHTPLTQDRTSSDTAHNTTHLLQDGYTNFQRNSYQGGINFDWDINKKNNFSGGLTYNHFAYINGGITNIEQITKDINNNTLSDILSYRNYDSRFRMSTYDWNLNYKKKFAKEGRELQVQYTASYGMPHATYSQSQTYNGSTVPYIGSQSNNPGIDQETEVSIDYTEPISKNTTIETGVKTILEHINSVTNVNTLQTNDDLYTPDPTQSYSINYDRKIYAAYASGTFSLFNYLKVKAGFRYEYTNTTIDYPNTTIPDYASAVPSIVLSHDLPNQQNIKLSYSHRIERPDYRAINPFRNLSDPYNITTGNPNLKPEIGDNIELGYNKTFGKGGNFYTGLFLRMDGNDLKPVTNFYNSYQVGDSVYKNVSVSMQQNIGMEYNPGISMSLSYPVNDKLNLRSNFNVTERYIVSPLFGNMLIGLRARINLNISYQFPKDFIAEVFGNYTTPWQNIQGQVPQQLTYNIAMRKQFWDKKASLGLTATNIFSEYIKQVTTITTSNYASYAVRELPYRSIGISFTYKFGKMEFKKDKKDEDSYLNNPPGEGN